MKLCRCPKGTTLVELMIVIGILSVIMVMVFAQFSTVLQMTNITRKNVKTESDIVTTIWPILKDIESAGFAIPATGCSPSGMIPPIAYSSGVLKLHSTASGDKKNSGAWSIIGNNCAVTGIDSGEYVVIINPANKRRVAYTNVQSNLTLASCVSSWVGFIAYWVPADGALECYETAFSKRGYTSTNKPTLCADGTVSFARSVVYNADSTNYQPMLDCVLDVDFRFGCLNPTTGNLSWRADHNCTALEGKLRFINVAIVLQESTRYDTQIPESSITLFASTGSPKTITLTSAQRYYKWKTVEKTIVLRNLE